MIGLTPHQARALAFIREFIAAHGWAPSLEEIAANLGVRTRSAAHRLVAELAARGAITHHPRRRRSIQLVAEPPRPDVEFLPNQLAVWVRVTAANAGVNPLDVVIECVRDAYTARRKPEQNASRETSKRPEMVA